MKKHIFILMTVMILMLSGCGAAGQNPADSLDPGPGAASGKDIKISSIMFLTAEENPENIWKIEWPNRYFAGSDEHILKSGWKEISDEDIEYILSHAEEYSKNYQTGSRFLCYVNISVIENGNLHYGYAFPVYDRYPEGFDEFAQRLDAIFGDDRTYIRTDGNIREITPDYFTLLTGITDDDVTEGTVAELIDHLGITDLNVLNGIYLHNYRIKMIAEDYYICRYLRYDIRSAPSTDEECAEYAEMLFEELGAEGDLTKGASEWYDNEWYEFAYGDKIVRVYRSELTVDDIRNYGGWVDSYSVSGKLYENTQPPSSEWDGYDAFDYTYNKDYRFLIAVSESYSREKEVFLEVAHAVERIDNRE